MQPIGRQATGQDLEAMIESMTLAFADDPVWGGWAFPDRQRASEQRRAIFGALLKGALRCEWVRVTQRCEAVASWIPPGRVELDEEGTQRFSALAEHLLGEHASVLLKGGDLFEASHPSDKPHYYLSLLGTHADHRGKGLGMALLRENLALIDTQGLPAYLESTNPKNLARYEQLGFAKIGAFTLPGGGPRVDTMWREPIDRS